MNKRHILMLMMCFFLAYCPVFGQFTEVAGSIGLDTTGVKDGGVAWGDFNNDGCLDLIFNTGDASLYTRLFLSDCNLPNPTFTDVTSSYAAGLLSNICERSVVWADCNHDGYLDFARNTNGRLELYLNKGPDSIPAYSFGDSIQNPNFIINAIPEGTVIEGVGWMDYNNDGWLDLAFENGGAGIEIYENPKDSTANFIHATPIGNSLGLPTGPSDGDYATVADYNDDGFIDILARKQTEFDLWTNIGNDSFVVNSTFNDTSGDRGCVLFNDFDRDGDFDIFWSDGGVNQIWEQIGINTDSFSATNEPAISSGVTPSGNIDGCACGDVDHDGDMDLFMTSGSGVSFLYINNTPIGGPLSFTQNNLGINVNGDGEGCAFGDYDNDGDLDLYVNVDGGANQLWRNGLNDTNYLKVKVNYCLSGSKYRDALGATVLLKDCNGNNLAGIKEVNGGKGHGSQSPPIIHFGLPYGPDTLYFVEVRFPYVSGVRDTILRAVMPNMLTNQTLTIANCSSSDALYCTLNVNAGVNDTICQGGSIVIGGAPTVSNGIAPFTYTWTPATGLNNSTIANPTATPATTTTYSVLVTDSFNIQNTDSITVVVGLLPNVFAGNDAVITTGGSVQLNATGAISYVWSPASGLSCTNCQNPIASPASTTTYYVSGMSVDSCVATDSVRIIVSDNNVNIVVFNALSPNSDGKNDKVIIAGIDSFPLNEILIFNRWGDEIIKLENYDNQTVYWDGRNRNGEMLPDGVYFYILKLKNFGELSGYIQLEN